MDSGRGILNEGPIGKRVIVSRLGGPTVKPAEYHFAGRVADITPRAARVDFENGVGQHVFSLDNGLWLEGENLSLEDCVLRDMDFSSLRCFFPEQPSSVRAVADQLRADVLKSAAETETLARAGEGLVAGYGAGAGLATNLRSRV